MCEIEIGNHVAIRQKNGTFLYKANENKPLLVKKKGEYKDKPHFPIVGEIENRMKKKSREMFESTVVEIVKFLKTK